MRNKIIGFTAGALLLSACGGGGGVPLFSGRGAPDEMMVIEGPPLSLPPDFELRPPQEGETAEYDFKAAERARFALTGKGGEKKAADGEDGWFVNKAGGGADPAIREKLSLDAAEPHEKKTWMNKLWNGNKKDEANRPAE